MTLTDPTGTTTALEPIVKKILHWVEEEAKDKIKDKAEDLVKEDILVPLLTPTTVPIIENNFGLNNAQAEFKSQQGWNILLNLPKLLTDPSGFFIGIEKDNQEWYDKKMETYCHKQKK